MGNISTSVKKEEIILDNPMVSISYHFHFNYLKLLWKAYVSSHEYRVIMEDVLHYIQLKKTRNLVFVYQCKLEDFITDTLWALEYWRPELNKIIGNTGKFAVVLNRDHHLVQTDQSRYQSKAFNNILDAETWFFE